MAGEIAWNRNKRKRGGMEWTIAKDEVCQKSTKRRRKDLIHVNDGTTTVREISEKMVMITLNFSTNDRKTVLSPM